MSMTDPVGGGHLMEMLDTGKGITDIVKVLTGVRGVG